MVQIRLNELKAISESWWKWALKGLLARRDVRDLCVTIAAVAERESAAINEQNRLRVELEALQKRYQEAQLECTRNKTAAIGLFQAAVSRGGFDNEKESQAFINLSRHRQ